MFLICIHDEDNHSPSYLTEAEQELVGAYHIEDSSMLLALFFLAAYAAIVTSTRVGPALPFLPPHLHLPALVHAGTQLDPPPPRHNPPNAHLRPPQQPPNPTNTYKQKKTTKSQKKTPTPPSSGPPASPWPTSSI